MLLRGYNGGKVRIDHCFNSVAANVLKEKLLAKFEDADIVVGRSYGLCSFYAERGGLLVGFEANTELPEADNEEVEVAETSESTEE